MMNTIRSGRITGNPLLGLCERMCIEVKRIFDGCISRLQNITFNDLVLTDFFPNSGVAPYSFIGAENYSFPTIDNLTVNNLDAGRLRIRYNAAFPVRLTFSDGYNNIITAVTDVVVPRDIVLSPPEDGREYDIEIIGKLLSRAGAVRENSTANITCCIAIITRVVVRADIVIPSYGECVYPGCSNYEDACAILFNTPPFSSNT